jgi:MFS family permease
MFMLLRNRNFALLWLAGLISLTGDQILLIGLPLSIYAITHSTLATSLAFVLAFIPQILFGTLAGVFVDRWNRKYVMIITDLLLALGLLPLFFFRSLTWLWIVYIVILFEFTISQFFKPAESALLPTLVEEDQLGMANSLGSLNINIASLIGPSLGGILVGLQGLVGVIISDVLSFLLSCLLIIGIVIDFQSLKHQKLAETAMKVQSNLRNEWSEGLKQVLQDRRVSLAFVARAGTSLGEGMFLILILTYVYTILRGGALELTWFLSALAVGGLLGGLLVGHGMRKISPFKLIGWGTVIFGCLYLATFNYPRVFPNLVPGLILFVFAGIFEVAFRTGITTILQMYILDRYLGRVFGAYNTISALFMFIGIVSAGILGALLNTAILLDALGSIYVLTGIIVLLFLSSTAFSKVINKKAS